MKEALIAFFGMFALDFVFARYTLSVATGRRLRASNYAALCVIFQGAVILSYVHNPALLLVAAAGAFAGTYVGSRKG
jgi:hypothetical protein